MDDDGKLTMARATPEKFDLLAEAQALTGHDAWGPLTLAGSRMIVRDLTRMVCLDVGKK
jgi:outer membrane protein assembly factor BamB